MVTEIPSASVVYKLINDDLIKGFFGIQFGQNSKEEKEKQLIDVTRFYIQSHQIPIEAAPI